MTDELSAATTSYESAIKLNVRVQPQQISRAQAKLSTSTMEFDGTITTDYEGQRNSEGKAQEKETGSMLRWRK